MGYYGAGPSSDDEGTGESRALFGGLRWRFEEHVPEAERQIGRIALFRAEPGLELCADGRFNNPRYNTVSCGWHHNITAAVCSFRAAKALRFNPASRHRIDSFMWRHSLPFDWTDRQLMDMGFMEPGQWF